MSSQAASSSQVNGVPSSSAQSTNANTQPTTTTSTSQANASQSQSATQPSQSQPSQSTQQTNQAQPGQQPQQQQQSQPSQPSITASSAPRPRDSRMIELLLTSQGVTSYEQRVPLLLLDFAYRHTSSILNDALHLSVDPYVTHAGSKASANAGVASIPATGGDATVSANAVKLAVAARLAYQFRGGRGAGGMSKDWLQDLAKEHNRVALPKVAPNEWGVRLPSERFVLTGTSWGLKDMWEEAGMEDSDEEDQEDATQRPQGVASADDGAMEGVEKTGAAKSGKGEEEDEEVGGEGVEGGTIEDVFGKDMEDEEMGGAS